MSLRPALGFFMAAVPALTFAAPTLQGCPVLPSDNVWNARVDALPMHASSAAWVASIGSTRAFHMDFGSGTYNGGPIGIPFDVVAGSQAKVPVAFDYADESDTGPYPIPPNARIEGGPAAGGDRHVLIVDKDNCLLYETFYSFPVNGGASWTAGSGAKYDLRSNALRPSGWTSADAAGLPILPGLVRYDEAAAGVIEHALRFTASTTQRAFIWPARHYASSNTSTSVPPMGARFRLKSSYDVTRFTGHARVIAQAMKTYGLILADNGSNWFVSGEQNEGWNNDVLHQLDVLRGSDFEAVDASSLMADPDSGRVASALSCAADGDNDGIPDCVEPAEGRNPALKDNDIFGNARLFAMQQYRDFLGREGDAAGIAYWTGLLGGSTTRAQAIESFLTSAEFQGTISPVARLYFAYFLRVPDYAGLSFWIGQFRGGLSLEAISNQFALSPEFGSRYGSLTNSQFVSLVYQNVLGRAPDAAGLAYWRGQLDSSAMTRGQVMTAFSESPEYRGLIASEIYVTMIYMGMLRRAPDSSGFTFWVNRMDAGGSGLELIGGFLAAAEYRGRFLP